MNDFFAYLRDPWTIFGFVAQFVFFLRFIIQWYQSEKNNRIIIPNVFWHLSLVGAVLILIYSLHRKDPVFITAGILQIIIFSRNLIIKRKEDK